MGQPAYYLAIDAGNTRAKLGLFDAAGQLLRSHGGPVAQAPTTARSWLQALPLPEAASVAIGWLSTGKDWDPAPWQAVLARPGLTFTQVHAQLPWPFPQRYQTPHTLGADRFAAIVAAAAQAPGRPVLVVDAGTAITYDAATAEPTYLGGAISPGLQMRYDALHTFTARLPRLTVADHPLLIGDSTEGSLRSGVQRACVLEVDSMIRAYREQLGPQTQVFLTGGDQPAFEKQLKNVNFADAFLVLRGIHLILKHIASL